MHSYVSSFVPSFEPHGCDKLLSCLMYNVHDEALSSSLCNGGTLSEEIDASADGLCRSMLLWLSLSLHYSKGYLSFHLSSQP